jgi:hypothetical protein
MKRLLSALALVALVSSGAYAVTDVAPGATPGSGSSGEGTFPILFEISLDLNNYCVGVGFDGEYFWVSAGDQMTGLCQFYIYDDAGNLLDTQAQGAGATGWGHRDMAWNGMYMFGSYSNMVDGYSDPATFAGFFIGPISPCRALAYDGSDFYTSGFGEYLWKLTWDGSWGTVAATENLGGPWDGAYGLAYDCSGGCLYMTTADYTGNIHKLAMDGFLLDTYTTLPEYDIQGGCTMADCQWGYVLVVLQQFSPDMLSFYDIGAGGPSPVEDASWGEIKSLFQ